MLYSGLALLLAAVLVMVLDFFGVVRGAAHFANAVLLISLVLLAAGTVASYRHRLHHH